jgi:PAS domain-containing protein
MVGLEAVHPEDRALCLERWTASLANRKPYQAELRYRRADSVYLWHLARAYPIFDERGEVTRWAPEPEIRGFPDPDSR